jgi:hypothetical protein
MSGATIIDQTTGKKKAMVKNQNPYDTYTYDDLVGNTQANNKITVV